MPGEATTANGDHNLPVWLENVQVDKAISEHLADVEKISSVTLENDNDTYENCISLRLRVDAEVLLKDGNTKLLSFVLKTPSNNPLVANIHEKLKLLTKEEQVYQKILPRFEQLYKDAGKSVQFAPKSYQIDRDLGVDYVLLEDLRLNNYKNANNEKGLDLQHMEEVLNKLAQFHAASAAYVEHFGTFGEEFTVGAYKETNQNLLKELNESSVFLTQLKKWKNGQYYYDKLADIDTYMVNQLINDHKINPREFNVLNHGDCWINNILFQYDAFGKIKNTRFLDFQVVKYGSPVFDLYYLILSSAAADIKLLKFEYFIHYYYDRLIENLKCLQYQRPLPKLRNLHQSFLKYGLAAYLVVSKVLPIVMLERNINEKLQNEIQDESKMKAIMYQNNIYVQAMSDILPWLDNRGLLDWK